MGPPRRNRSNSNVSNRHVNGQHPHTRQPQQAPTPSLPVQPEPHTGMTPASRYNHNLKVLRRRDPSIVSIFDQFSHVCVYHHNGKKWEKHGFEGSMFLYERESYPPYGFYILNRMGMDDYVQRLYPEDDIGAHGSYLMLRSYPEYTARRLALANARLTDNPHKFSDVYAIRNPEKVSTVEKGKSATVGLWMFATDAREPMIDVMTRLHSFIKKNIPYPDEFRYGPDRPPPPNPHLRTSSTPHSQDEHEKHPGYDRSMDVSRENQGQWGNDRFSSNHPSQAYSNGGTSELDKLFAKIGPSNTTTSSPDIPTSTSAPCQMTVDSLFAALGGRDMARRHTPSPAPASPPTSTPHRGLALLDSIFASATPPPPITNHGVRQPYAQQNGFLPSSSAPSILAGGAQPITVESPPILSPQPTSTSLPQILNQDVISSLLGLTPTPSPDSRSSSAAPSSSSSRNNRYEGDNEGGSDGGFSESSTVLDADAETNLELQSAGASAGIPLLSVSVGEGWATNGPILGDVTPRPPLRPELHGSKSSTPPLYASSLPRKSDQDKPIPSYSERPNSSLPASSSTAVESAHTTTKEAPRSLIPFQADSTLWPYPRAPLDDRSSEVDEDIVELDFADTSALSDPDMFRNRRVQQQEKGKAKKSGKRGKKERMEENERERMAIEKSWDVPSQSQSSSSVPPSPARSAHSTNHVNGKSRASASSSRNAMNGSRIHEDMARQAIVASVSSQETGKLTTVLQRNEFVREVLMLIHTDKTFVDRLYHDYMTRL